MKKIVSLLILAIVIISCGAISGGKKQANLVNTKWVIEDKSVTSKIPTLNVEDKRITGSGFCNKYFSDVVLNQENGNFVVGNVGSTKMACEEMKAEQNYFNLLQQVNKYQVKDGYLELYKDGLLLLKFKKADK